MPAADSKWRDCLGFHVHDRVLFVAINGILLSLVFVLFFCTQAEVWAFVVGSAAVVPIALDAVLIVGNRQKVVLLYQVYLFGTLVFAVFLLLLSVFFFVYGILEVTKAITPKGDEGADQANAISFLFFGGFVLLLLLVHLFHLFIVYRGFQFLQQPEEKKAVRITRPLGSMADKPAVFCTDV
ncbi:hypothetical protein M3Y99_00655500 [Aphelenchoides fujianensis]|nr:hypothetical protein M3Y99_00655500 [Aphelenchoides fujianensis]